MRFRPALMAVLAALASRAPAMVGGAPPVADPDAEPVFMLLGSGNLRPILKGSLLTAVMGITFAWGTVNILGYNGVVAAHALAVFSLIVWVSVCIQRAFGKSRSILVI